MIKPKTLARGAGMEGQRGCRRRPFPFFERPRRELPGPPPTNPLRQQARTHIGPYRKIPPRTNLTICSDDTMKVFKILASWCSRLLLCAIGSAFSVVMPFAAAPVMAPAAATAAPKSSLEAMLDTVKKRGVQEQDELSFLPPLPPRPRCRGRPPTPRQWPLPPPGFKDGNGEAVVESTDAN